MIETERKAAALADAAGTYKKALCRAIEAHEAFRQEVSDAVEEAQRGNMVAPILHQFIITKPDPLVEAMQTMIWSGCRDVDANTFRAALAARGLEIREID